MHNLRVALAQLNTTVGDFEGNRQVIMEAAREAAALAADIVVYPELALPGYPAEDLLIRGSFISVATAELEALATEAAGLPPLVVGCLDYDGQLHNAAALVHGGRVVATYRKQMLPNYGVFDEVRYFQPGHGTQVFEIAGVPVGVTICEDIWYPTGPARRQALAGAQVILNINASPFYHGKTHYRERMISTRAADDTVAVVYVNQVGGQDELVFDGNSMVVNSRGQVLARAASMKPELLVVDIPVEEIKQEQLHESRLRRDRRPDEVLRPQPITPPFAGARPPLVRTEREAPNSLAEVYDGLVLGTRDYLRKSGFERVWVAVSGGIDSALVATIAVDAVGAKQVTGVSMPSRFSSRGSVTDAEELARRLGIRLASLPLEPIHHEALVALRSEFARTAEGTAEENLQSRIRGMLVMALSNKQPGSLVLTTGNKSEYACGYATLYGDMVGGFAVIKDVPKTLVWELARYRNTIGMVIPRNSITKAPSAELRADQLDTDSLPEYEILDPIIEAYVEDDLSLEAIVSRGFDEWTVRRVIEMINRNEYKRRQSPPGVKITTRAFGRDRRLPLASRYQGF